MARPKKTEPVVMRFADASPEEKQAIQELVVKISREAARLDPRRGSIVNTG
jgi:hypothetical protein